MTGARRPKSALPFRTRPLWAAPTSRGSPGPSPSLELANLALRPSSRLRPGPAYMPGPDRSRHQRTPSFSGTFVSTAEHNPLASVAEADAPAPSLLPLAQGPGASSIVRLREHPSTGPRAGASCWQPATCCRPSRTSLPWSSVVSLHRAHPKLG